MGARTSRGALWPSRGRARCSFLARNTCIPHLIVFGWAVHPAGAMPPVLADAQGCFLFLPASASLGMLMFALPMAPLTPAGRTHTQSNGAGHGCHEEGAMLGATGVALYLQNDPGVFLGCWHLGIGGRQGGPQGVVRAINIGIHPCELLVSMACTGSGAPHALHTTQARSEMTNFQPICAAHGEQVYRSTGPCALRRHLMGCSSRLGNHTGVCQQRGGPLQVETLLPGWLSGDSSPKQQGNAHRVQFWGQLS